MIEFDNLTFIYDNKPLMQHFTCCIARGEKAVLYGPSGHGKSTLLASVPGFVATTVQQVRRRTAWLPQEFTLPYDTIQELIEAPFRLRINQALKPSRETVLEHFDRLGLEHELYDKRSIEISGGQRQRIMLMIAALLQKDIVLLDEPTSALDPDSIARVIDYIRSLHEATVLMVSHDARFIDSFDRKIYIGD